MTEEFNKYFTDVGIALVNYRKSLIMLKFAKVISVFKKDDKENIENYQPIFFFQFFPKFLNVLCITVCTNIHE